jgi:hypothetical protein
MSEQIALFLTCLLEASKVPRTRAVADLGAGLILKHLCSSVFMTFLLIHSQTHLALMWAQFSVLVSLYLYRDVKRKASSGYCAAKDFSLLWCGSVFVF